MSSGWLQKLQPDYDSEEDEQQDEAEDYAADYLDNEKKIKRVKKKIEHNKAVLEKTAKKTDPNSEAGKATAESFAKLKKSESTLKGKLPKEGHKLLLSEIEKRRENPTVWDEIKDIASTAADLGGNILHKGLNLGTVPARLATEPDWSQFAIDYIDPRVTKDEWAGASFQRAKQDPGIQGNVLRGLRELEAYEQPDYVPEYPKEAGHFTPYKAPPKYRLGEKEIDRRTMGDIDFMDALLLMGPQTKGVAALGQRMLPKLLKAGRSAEEADVILKNLYKAVENAPPMAADRVISEHLAPHVGQEVLEQTLGKNMHRATTPIPRLGLTDKMSVPMPFGEKISNVASDLGNLGRMARADRVYGLSKASKAEAEGLEYLWESAHGIHSQTEAASRAANQANPNIQKILDAYGTETPQQIGKVEGARLGTDVDSGYKAFQSELERFGVRFPQKDARAATNNYIDNYLNQHMKFRAPHEVEQVRSVMKQMIQDSFSQGSKFGLPRKTFRFMMNIFKTTKTMGNATFAANNVPADTLLMHAAGMREIPTNFKRALDVRKALSQNPGNIDVGKVLFTTPGGQKYSLGQLIKESHDAGVLDPSLITKAERIPGAEKTLSDLLVGRKSWTADRAVGTAFSGGANLINEKIMQEWEQMSTIAMYAYARSTGLPVDAAWRFVRTAKPNYNAPSLLVQQNRDWAPFLTFGANTARNLPQLLTTGYRGTIGGQNLANNILGYGGEEEYLPSEQQQKYHKTVPMGPGEQHLQQQINPEGLPMSLRTRAKNFVGPNPLDLLSGPPGSTEVLNALTEGEKISVPSFAADSFLSPQTKELTKLGLRWATNSPTTVLDKYDENAYTQVHNNLAALKAFPFYDVGLGVPLPIPWVSPQIVKPSGATGDAYDIDLKRPKGTPEEITGSGGNSGGRRRRRRRGRKRQ